MYQEPVVTEIEKTKRDMYADLKRFESMVGSTHLFKTFQDSLEAHLEELRKSIKVREDVGQAFGESMVRVLSERDSLHSRLTAMTEERDQIQGRLHAIDHAYCEQSNRSGAQAREIERLNELNRIAGEELIRVQGIARQHLDDCRSAEKLSDDLSEKLTHATTVIGQQEQLIVGQRMAIADLYMERAGIKSKKCVHSFHHLHEHCIYCGERK